MTTVISYRLSSMTWRADDDVAAGFYKPHLPWTAPRRFFEVRDEENLARSAEPAVEDIPVMALQTKLSGFGSSDSAPAARRVYYTCMSFIDKLMGTPLASRACLQIVILGAAIGAPYALAVEPIEIAARLDAMPRAHPRLFLDRAAEVELKRRIAAQPMLQAIQADIVAKAGRELSTKPVERVLVGFRLLATSRTVLDRVLHLGLAWRMTGKLAYFERARDELIAVASFTDWNPGHFLDVAEMTIAVAVAYDWFHSEFDDATRDLLRVAIVEKGLKPSLINDAWTRQNNNWNQVCNAAMVIGALAVADHEPALTAEMIARAVATVPLAMEAYAPDGGYPEGAMYWGYGTTFNIMLITALESAFGHDFGLSRTSGFLSTADYYLHVVGPTGFYFNYSDAGRSRQGVSPAMFWFAARRNQPDLAWNEWKVLERRLSFQSDKGRMRWDPMLLLWMPDMQGPPPRPGALSWSGRGRNPVALHRSGWDRDASYVAIKGGSASLPHAHMDAGSFIMDSSGFRWADDFGGQNYHSLESAGIPLGGARQEAPRWSVFRLGTSSHNVLMVDGQQQRIAAHAPIVVSKERRTVVDLSETYAGQLANAKRGVALFADGSVRVQDEFATLDRSTRVRWAMLTAANVEIDGPGCATLTQGGKSLTLRILAPAGLTPVCYPTDPPPAPTDLPNPGTRMIGFECSVPAGHCERLVVQLVPGGVDWEPAAAIPLALW